MTTHSRNQRGSVLLFSLITLTILLISSVALVRSFNSSLFNAGNLAFKRDLTNQAEKVWPIVYAQMTTGPLSTPAARAINNINYNYRAQTLLASSPTSKGIPDALIDDSSGFAQFYQVATTANDIQVPEQGVTIRYVVDRLCNATGLESALGASNCTVADSGNSNGGDAKSLVQPPAPSAGVVYRLSIRVTGPRKTQAFFQTTFSL